MKNKEKWYEGRIFNYVFFSIVYIGISKLFDFEIAVLIGIGQILGESSYNSINKEK